MGSSLSLLQRGKPGEIQSCVKAESGAVRTESEESSFSF